MGLDGMVGKKVCKKTVGCAVENKVCVDFELTACDEIAVPTNKKECKKNGCVFNKDAKVCALKSAEDTPKDKCSKLNEEKCTGKKGVKKGCVYNDGSCSQTVVGCAVNNGQATECAAAEGCAYNVCTEQCSKSKSKE